MSSRFIYNHFSPQSYLFLMMRLMDPNDVEFTEDTFGDIVRLLVEKAGEKLVAEATARAKVTAAQRARKP